MDPELPDWLVAALARPVPRPRVVWSGGFVCPACDEYSIHRGDANEGYCARCRWWTGDPQRAWERPALFRAHGKVPPGEPGIVRGLSLDLVIIDEIAG